MSKTNNQLGWRTVSLWHIVVILVCAGGTVLAYNGPFTSEAWQSWAGQGAWKRDVLRAVLAAITAIYILWQIDVVTSKQASLKDCALFVPEKLHEWIFFSIVTGFLLWLMLYHLPTSFERELLDKTNFSENGKFFNNKDLLNIHKRMLSGEMFDRFKMLWMPYLPYAFYVFGFWHGIVWPVFVSLTRSIRRNWKWWQDASKALDQSLTHLGMSKTNASPEAYEKLLITFQKNEVGLLESAQRYITVLLSIALLLLAEQLTTIHETLTPEAVEYGKLVLWLILGPAFVTFLVIVVAGYHNTVHKLRNGLSMFVEELSKRDYQSELLEKAMGTIDDITWRRSPVAFVFSVVKSANIMIFLMLTIVGYVMHMSSGGKWIDVFLPSKVVDFVQWIFK